MLVTVLANEPIRATLQDLRSAESRGKWWLVGAAWGGDPLVERLEEEKNAPTPALDVLGDSALLKLAKKQGMNTDIRRSIFVVLMSSEVRLHLPRVDWFILTRRQDFVDACERLGQLNLKEVQQREIVRVLLHCCGNVSADVVWFGDALVIDDHLSRP